MSYFYIRQGKGGVKSVDLTPIENEIISRGGTVDKADDKATVAELVVGIVSIPIEGYGQPLQGDVVENVAFSTLDVTDNVNVEMEEEE